MDPADLLPLAREVLKAAPTLYLNDPEEGASAMVAMLFEDRRETRNIADLSKATVREYFERYKAYLIRKTKAQKGTAEGKHRLSVGTPLGAEDAATVDPGAETLTETMYSAMREVKKAQDLVSFAALPTALVESLLNEEITPKQLSKDYPVSESQIIVLRKAHDVAKLRLDLALTSADDMEEQIKSLLEFEVI